MRMRRVGYGRSALLDWVQLAYSAQTLQLTKYNWHLAAIDAKNPCCWTGLTLLRAPMLYSADGFQFILLCYFVFFPVAINPF